MSCVKADKNGTGKNAFEDWNDFLSAWGYGTPDSASITKLTVTGVFIPCDKRSWGIHSQQCFALEVGDLVTVSAVSV